MAIITTGRFNSKDPADTVLCSFDFSNVLDLDYQEHLTDAVWYSTLVGPQAGVVVYSTALETSVMSVVGLGFSGDAMSATPLSGADALDDMARRGVVVDPSYMFTGVLNITATNTSYMVTGGVAGEIYELSVVVKTSFGRTIKLRGQLAVVAAN
jgi:hypothetical protein